MNFLLKNFLFISILFFANVSTAMAKNTQNYLPLETYSALPNKSLMRVSPSGERIAYRLTENGKDLFVIVDLKQKKIIRGFNIAELDPQDAYFISEDKVILKIEKRSKIMGFIGRHDISTAYLYDIEKNKVSQLLNPGKGIYKGQTQLGNIVGVSSDAKWAYMTAYTLRGEGGVPKKSLMKVNLNKTYKTPKIYEEGASGTIDYFLDVNNKVIARERYNQETNIHKIEIPDGSKWKVIFKEETPYITKSFSGVTADGQSLVMVENRAGVEGDYYFMSLVNGDIKKANFEQKGVDIAYTLADINRVVYGIKYTGFQPSYTFFDENLNEKFKKIKAELPNSSITLQSKTPNSSKVIVFAEFDGLVGDFLSFENNQLAHVATLWSQHNWEDVNNIVEFKFKARDGMIIPTLLTVPNSAVESKEKLPAILLPHGGPESYDTKTFHWLAQYFANRGFLVIQPQFRGSSGFGAEHTLKGRGEWGKKMQTDLVDAVNKLVDMGEIDPNKVCIVGSSYGGYAALAGAAFTPDLFQCAISINGVSDIAEMLENTEDDYGEDSSVLSYWHDSVGKNQINDELLNQISPIKHVDKINVPVLLIHGTDDKVVSVEQSEDMFDALTSAKKEVKYIPLKMVGHQLKTEVTRLKVLKAIDEFVNNYIH